MGIGGASGEQHGVGVPCYRGDGAPDGLLEMLGNPPVILFLEVADGDHTVTGADGELGLGGRPTDEGSSSVDSKQDKRWLVALRRWFPDECVPVLRAGHNTAGVRRNVETGDSLVMPLQLVLQPEGIASLAIQLDGRISGDGQGRAVDGEGVVGDGVVEEVVDLGCSHLDVGSSDYVIGVALYYHGD